jgi:gamma-glutamyl-gamma-aminobutyraldehyde dehydrogenase
VSVKQLDRVLDYIAAARADGRILLGGNQSGGVGCFVESTIVVDVPSDSVVVTEEIFGPVLAVAVFDTEEQAIDMANDTPFGLAASAWTANLDRALRMPKTLHVGTVSVNTVDALSPSTPFGGFKASGFGSDLSAHAIDKFTGLKTTWIAKPLQLRRHRLR